MIDLSFEYWNKLTEQIIFISALLGGFSLAVIASLLSAKEKSPVSISLFRAASIAAASFLVTLFAMTKILLLTTPGYPMEVTTGSFALPRYLGMFTFLTGIISLIVIISLAGWTKSRKIGLFTTILGIIAFLLILIMLM